MEEELNSLKSALRALVVSTPTQVDLRTLLRDYRTMMGAPLPVTKWGYRDPLLFLKERCSDCFLFQGPSSNPVLTLIVTDKIKHIDKMVQKQRVASTQKIKGKRRSILEATVSPVKKDLIVNTFNNLKTINRHNNLSEVKKINNQLPNTNKIYNKSTANLDRQSEVNVQNAPNLNRQSEENVQNVPNLNRQSEINVQKGPNFNRQSEVNVYNTPEFNKPGNGNRNESAVYNFLRKRMPLDESCQNLDEKYAHDNDSDSGRKTSSSTSSTKMAHFEELKQEIQEMVSDYPEGLWCSDLIRLYREKYKRELDFTRFGYTSIVSLCCVVRGVVVSRLDANGDWLLSDERAPPPARSHPSQRPAHLRAISMRRLAPHPTAERNTEDALPGINFDPDVFPPDCMHFMDSIPSISLLTVEAGAMLEVMVGEVYSPSHFWLLRLGDEYNIAMEDVMDEMTNYYNNAGSDRYLAMGAVQVGHYCSSVYEGDWHRSIIVKLIDSDTVKVRHVDYGTVETVQRGALRPLLRRWSEVPAQALRARLAGVRPPAAGTRWPRAAAAHFLDLVRNKRIIANVVAVDKEEDIVEVFLVDTSTEEDVHIHEKMIQGGHADTRPDSALRTSECYLYPRFEALESGDTPNYAEIHAYLRDGIALDYVEDYRRHVPLLPDALALVPPTPTPSPTPPPSPTAETLPPTPSPPPHLPCSISEPEVCDTSPPSDVHFCRALSLQETPAVALNRVPLHPISHTPPPGQTSPTRDPLPASVSVPVIQTTHMQQHCEPLLPTPQPRYMPPQPNGSPSITPESSPSYPPMTTPMEPSMFWGSSMFGQRPHVDQQLRPQVPPALYPQMSHAPHPQMRNASHPTMPYAPHPEMPNVPHPQMPHAPNPQMPHAPHPQMPHPHKTKPTPHSPPSRPPGFESAPGMKSSPSHGDVVLSAAECEIFYALSGVSPQLANEYLVEALGRKLTPAADAAPSARSPSLSAHTNSGRSSLNPLAAEFRLVTAQTQTDVPVGDLIQLNDSPR